jgi:hypothetical protein
MAFWNEFAKIANEQPKGNKLRAAANDEFLRHIGEIEDEEKNCEICMEEREGLHAKGKGMRQLQKGIAV